MSESYERFGVDVFRFEHELLLCSCGRTSLVYGNRGTHGRADKNAPERANGQKRHRTGQPKDRTRPCQSKSRGQSERLERQSAATSYMGSARLLR